MATEVASSDVVDRGFEECERLADQLRDMVDVVPLLDGRERDSAAERERRLSSEHWQSVRYLLRAKHVPSALVVHQAQIESIARSMWLTYVASEDQIAEFTLGASLVSEFAASTPGTIDDMLQQLAERALKPSFSILTDSKAARWSFSRSETYRQWRERDHLNGLVRALMFGTNALGVLSYMHAATLRKNQKLEQQVCDAAAKHPQCVLRRHL